MPCEHKFINDLQLQYVNWEVKTLFIGTFNPGWAECPNNNADWFYGRTQRNEFWCILPAIHRLPSLLEGNRNTWIEFCRKNKIAITDILSLINDADPELEEHRNTICKFKDEELENLEVTTNNIPAILENYPNIKQICITRQRPLPNFWEECFIDMFQFINDNPLREIEVKYLRSPSRGARRGVAGNFCEFIANRWLQQGYLIIP
ncbi:MAG TPA: hypothetical protein VK498_05725 [Ferruginibacter sp.]|nr:hypothetical protein [Ferruginibacter sp.]